MPEGVLAKSFHRKDTNRDHEKDNIVCLHRTSFFQWCKAHGDISRVFVVACLAVSRRILVFLQGVLLFFSVLSGKDFVFLEIWYVPRYDLCLVGSHDII